MIILSELEQRILADLQEVVDETEYLITIYHNGVCALMPVRGKEQYLLNKEFLGNLTGLKFSAEAPPRPIPDPSQDFYMLNDVQIEVYRDYRAALRK